MPWICEAHLNGARDSTVKLEYSTQRKARAAANSWMVKGIRFLWKPKVEHYYPPHSIHVIKVYEAE